MKLIRILNAVRRREDGFTMIVTMLSVLIASVLVAAALDAALGDTRLVQNDLDQKQAYLAARAGIADYQFHMNADPNYWTSCPAPANASVPGSTGATYTIAPIPASGQTACDPNNPVSSMVESNPSSPAYGTFRIRSTGYSHNAYRSIVATFRERSFLDYVYYTKYETLAPPAYSTPQLQTQAATTCDQWWRQGRPPSPDNVQPCIQIFWASGDVVNGPLHTEDALAICGSPTFGRGPQDNIEVVDPAGHSTQGKSGCSDGATFPGNYTAGAASIPLPPTNAQIKAITASNYQFTGQTHITLNGANMTVTNAGFNGGVAKSIPFPSNGVVFVSTSTCSTTYTPFNVTYPGPSGCGTVTVDGSYTQSLTIASDNDIVIDGSVTRPNGNNSLLGLVAQNYVRLYHPCTSNTNQAGSLSNPTIDAAMLAVTGSFIVDNYNCGAQLGNLNVLGAITQVFRGPVGLIGTSGYLKNYVYDDNLRAEEPPHFLEPVQAAWHVIRETECNPGTTVC